MALDEDKARHQCLEVARQVLDQHDSQRGAGDQETTTSDELPELLPEQQVVEEVPSLVEEAVPADKSEAEASNVNTITTTREVTPVEPEEQLGSRDNRGGRWFSWIRRGGSTDTSEEDEAVVDVTKDGVPKQFAATVVAISKAGYNDALLVLSNRYVFVVSRARQSRIEPGDVIVARKKEGLSGRRSFLFYGRGASVDAQRVECGHFEPSRQTKRRCKFASKHLGVDAL